MNGFENYYHLNRNLSWIWLVPGTIKKRLHAKYQFGTR